MYQTIYTVLLCSIAVFAIASVAVFIAESFVKTKIKNLVPVKPKEEITTIENDKTFILVRDGKADVVEQLPVKIVKIEVQPEQPEKIYPEVEKMDEVATTPVKEPESPETVNPDDGRYVLVDEDKILIEIDKDSDSDYDKKYAGLKQEYKDYLNAFTDYVLAKNDVKETKSKRHVSYRIRSMKMVVITIKRDVPVARFDLANTQLLRSIRERKLKDLKVNTVDISLVSDEALDTAKHTADIAYGEIQQEFDYRKEQTKLRRAESRKAIKRRPRQ